MNPLTQIPPEVRAVLYWAGYLIGILGQGLTIVWGSIAAASPDVTMPLWLVVASAVLGLLQTQLNLLAGSNLPSYSDVVEDEAGPVAAAGPGDRGEVD